VRDVDAAQGGLTFLQVGGILFAGALVVAGAAWFWARWRSHDETGRPRPPDDPIP
jgi:hypothetical protein